MASRYGMAVHLVILSEATLPGVLARAVLGRRQVLLKTRPFVLALHNVLQQIAEFLVRRNRIETLTEFDSEAGEILADRVWERKSDVFLRTEAWLNRHFEFVEAERRFGLYADAYKHACCNLVAPDLPLAQALAHLEAHYPEAALRHHGIESAVRGLASAYRMGADKAPPSPAQWAWRRPGVLLLMAAAAVYVGFWILLRTRRVRPAPQTFFLAADYLDGGHHQRILDEIVARNPAVLVVFRSQHDRMRSAHAVGTIAHCDIAQGWFDLASAARAYAIAMHDVAMFLRHCGGGAPRLLRGCASLVLYRIKTLALLGRFRFQFFLARDDYNPEHIVRTAILRAGGIVSVSLNHGLPVPETVNAVWRYIDYDIYYVFGAALYERYYRKTWSPRMTVKAVGTFGMTRERRQRLSRPRPKDIIVFVNLIAGVDRVMEAARRLALVFDDRSVFVRMKPTIESAGHYAEFQELFVTGPSNIRRLAGDIYDGLLQASYAVTTVETSVAVEALQFGLATFVLDFGVAGQSYYREFNGLCVGSVDEVAARIQAIESGRESYDFALYAGLIDLGGRVPYDVLLEDLGLTEPAVSAAAQVA